jgi:septum site-determining protein MinD
MYREAEIIAVAGAKGGVGKTTTSINVGAALAATGQSVVVVELDLLMANFVDFLDFDVDLSSAVTLHDVLGGEAPLQEAIYPAPGDLAVVPSGLDLDGYGKTSIDRLGSVLKGLKDAYDVVIVDTGAGLSDETVVAMRIADRVVLVSTPRVAAIRDADKTATMVDNVDGSLAGLVLTMSGTGRSPSTDRIAAFLDLELLGHVPEDQAVPSSQDVGRPVVVNAPESDAAAAYRRIAERLQAQRQREEPTDTADRDEALAATVDHQVTQTQSHGRDGTEPAADAAGERADHSGDADADGDELTDVEDGETTPDVEEDESKTPDDGSDEETGSQSLAGRIASMIGL